jgi:hypothetical protein
MRYYDKTESLLVLVCSVAIIGLICVVNVWANNSLESECEAKNGSYMRSILFTRSLCDLKK